MAKDFFQTIAAKAGFAGEYEPLIESEFTATPAGPYVPGEEGVFRTVSSTAGRTIQLLQSSPVYVETFQTSDAVLRVPSGSISGNDASDGRFYFIRNNQSATGTVSIEKNDGTLIRIISPGEMLIVIHGEDDDWDRFEAHPVRINASDPTPGDDNNAGYEVGDHWINTANQRIFQAIDVTSNSAIWERLDQPKTNISAFDPVPSNDDTEGYEIGSTWVNTASLPPRVWTAVDAATGAAEWIRHTNIKDNISSDEPLQTDDANSDYEVGSQWFESTLQELYVCTDATVGAAEWLPAGQVGSRVLPGAVLVGSILDYPASGSAPANQIQYVGVRLFSGRVYDRVIVFIDSGGTAGRFVQGGIYDVTDPAVFSDPLNRVAQTDVVDTNITQPGYYEIPLTDGAGTPQTYTPPISGVHWIAFIQSSNGIKFASTVQFRGSFLARRTETVGSTLLPANAGTLTNPSASMLLVALIEQGIALP